jgi:peroxiredoxin
MLTANTNAEKLCGELKQPGYLTDRLTGRRLPAAQLICSEDRLVDLQTYTIGLVVIYFYGGNPALDEASPPEDIALHSGYRHHHYDLTALHVRVVGVSTEPPNVQIRRKTAAQIPHELLSDPYMRIGQALGLPTDEHDGRIVYQRVSLIVRKGIIYRKFYPISDAVSNASQIVAWIRDYV